MLRLKINRYYRVKTGQSLRLIAKTFGIAERVLVKENGLTGEPLVGQILIIPSACGNAYTAKEGESKTLLCGSDAAYAQKNGTDILYPGMRVIL